MTSNLSSPLSLIVVSIGRSPPSLCNPTPQYPPDFRQTPVDSSRFPRSATHQLFFAPQFFEIFGSRSTMVSIRRRKLLGLYSGRSSFLSSLPRFCDNGNTPQNPVQYTKPVSVHPMPSVDAEQPEEKNISKLHPGSSNASGSSTSKEQHDQQYPVPEVKRRKRHRRKHLENQEPCLMRGVYFKNMKWQAAIKVDKKQIHLGTVSSQEEAARLYDRAAFMCGREPNFELSEEEKQELRKFKWDEFLAMTRSAITNKKHRRRSSGAGLQRKSEPSMQHSDWEGEQGLNGFSASEDADPDTSVY